MPIRAVIFDLDGTLLNTLDDLADAANAVLSALGYPVHPVERYKQFVGDGVAMLIKRALPADAAADEQKALDLMHVEYKARLHGKTRPYPGIPALLDALRARNIAMAVLSNKLDRFARATVEDFFGRWPWAAIMGESQRYPRKPDPAGALAIAEKLGIPPAQFLFVGDSPMDMACALGAGMTPVGVTWGFRARPTLEAAGGKIFIDAPIDLLRFV